MKKAAWLVLLLLVRAWAWGEVTSERVEVIYPRPELAGYAAEVDRVAEAALDVLEPLFGPRPGRVVLRLEDDVDWFNGYASTLPRRTVELLAPFPAGGLIDLRSPSVTYLLLVHELTHTRQLTYRKKPDGSEPLRLGLVTELSAPMPPAWFVEGIATYMESRFTPGGRLDWGFTQGLLNALLSQEGALPDLAGMSLYTYRDWPGGQTRYLLGVRFVDYLIEKHGWQAILATLQQYNAGLLVPPSFATAWRRANGSELADEWAGWVAAERRRMAAYASVSLVGKKLVEPGRDPALSPGGGRLAYQNESGVWVARPDGSQARWLAAVHPQKLWWADEHTLVYSRYFREGDGVASDVFALDAESGRETRLTRGQHARLAAPAPDGCVYFVRDRAGEPASLRRLCGGEVAEVWRFAGGEHPLGLAVSPGGRLALAVWHGGSADLALLEGGRLEYLIPGRLQVEPPAAPPDPCAGGGAALGDCYERNRHQHLAPVWDGDYALLFTADEGGVFDLYRLELPGRRVSRLSASLSGVLSAVYTPEGYLAASPGSEGYELDLLPALEEPVAVAAGGDDFRTFCSGKPPGATAPTSTPADRLQGGRWSCPQAAASLWEMPQRESRRGEYRPWPSLAPYGWLVYPAAYGGRPALEFAAYGLDDSGVYSYRLSAGYAPGVSGPLAGAYAYLAAGVGAGVDLAGETGPLGFLLQAGTWPAAGGGVASGALFGVASAGRWDRWNWRGRLLAGPVWEGGWRLDWNGGLRAGLEERDPWGYLKSGGYAGFSAASGYLAAYAGAAWRAEPFGLGLTLEGRLEGGEGVTLGPGALAGGGAAAQLRLRHAVKTEWRGADGWLALERLTLAPGLRVWYDGRPGYGGELGIYADTVWFYALPVPVGLRLGYADGWWWRLELGPW
ncbi:TolB family protein [Oceanithermus sp.]